MCGEGRLPEEVPENATSLQCITAIQALEAEVCLPEVFAVCGVTITTLNTVSARLI
jgi:hypothetical protein